VKERLVVPEILDELPPDDPRAVRSRRDLRLINSLMGNYRWLSRRIEHVQKENPHGWVEIGSGDGSLRGALGRGKSEHFHVCGIDFAPRPDRWPESWDWCQGDIFKQLPNLPKHERPEGILANLFLHHFECPALSDLGEIIQNRFHRVIVSEPARYPIFRNLGYGLFPLVNDVTRHDMQVSIGAGFRPGELFEALGLGPDWKLRESVTALGAYRFEAWKE